MRFDRIPLLVLFVAFFSALKAAPDSAGPQWAQEMSDIPPSPRVTYGRLENGLRYALLPNRTPPGQVSLRLLVLAGSLNEQDDELGYAHFVEHMAFRSTRNFPGDGKIKFLQGLGVAWGPHVNADTSFTYTLYKLDLPENSPATLAGAVRILRDFADGLVFDEKELERERGVVLSEALARHNPDQDRDIARLELIFDGTSIPQRWPIGTEASIKHAGPADLRAFYDAWYRPENMIVVIAGDIEPAKLASLLQSDFASLRARGVSRSVLALGALAARPNPSTEFISEPRNGVQVELGSIRSETPPPDTLQRRLETLRLEVAKRMVRRRLTRLTNQSERPITAFALEEGYRFGRFYQSEIVTVGDTGKWPVVLATAEQELRQALDHGFDASELAPVKDEFRTEVEEFAKLAATIPTEALANRLVDEIEAKRVFVLPDERLPQVLAGIDQLTAEDCRQALRDAWGDSSRYLVVTASSRLMKPTAGQLHAKYEESRAVAVAPAVSLQAVKFAYTDFGPPGAVVSKEHIADLDLWLVRFANGVRLNLKRTDFEHQLVQFSLRIGSGRLEEPANQPGLAFWAAPAAYFGGLRQHTDDELDRVMSGTHIGYTFTSGSDAFQVSTMSAIGELPMSLRVVTAYVTDAAFRPEDDRRLAGYVRDSYIKLEQSADGVIAQQIAEFLAGGDPRLGFPSRKMVQGYSIATMGAWLRPVFQTGAIEVALVGDFDVDQAIAEVAKTFGALPTRAPKPDLASQFKPKFPTPPQSQTFKYWTTSKDRPTTLALYWPVNESVTMAEKRRLQLLGSILQDRLRTRIRVEQGDTYTPVAQFEWDDTYAGYASLHCQVEVRPERARKLGTEIRELALNLGKHGVTAEELARAQALGLADVRHWQHDNTYWISSVLADAQEHPARLDNARNVEHEYSAATPEEIDALAARYLTDQNLFQFTIKPEYHRS